MNEFFRVCRGEILGNKSYSIFDAIYLFGSSLYSTQPNDIDILLIYEDGKRVEDVCSARIKLIDTLSAAFCGMDVHCVTLSEAELKKTRFLDKVKSEKIK